VRMIKDYKTYAQDLYNIKVSALPRITKQINDPDKILLTRINELRSELRKNLDELSDEFMLESDEITPDTVKQIKSINNRLLDKFYIMANGVKNKTKPQDKPLE